MLLAAGAERRSHRRAGPYAADARVRRRSDGARQGAARPPRSSRRRGPWRPLRACGTRPPPVPATKWPCCWPPAPRRSRPMPGASPSCTPPLRRPTPPCSSPCSPPMRASTGARAGGDTPLLIAAASGRTEVVQALLARSPESRCAEQCRRHGADRRQSRRLPEHLPPAARRGRQQGAAQRRRRFGGRRGLRPRLRAAGPGNRRQELGESAARFSTRSKAPCRCRPPADRSRRRLCGRRRTACPSKAGRAAAARRDR